MSVSQITLTVYFVEALLFHRQKYWLQLIASREIQEQEDHYSTETAIIGKQLLEILRKVFVSSKLHAEQLYGIIYMLRLRVSPSRWILVFILLKTFLSVILGEKDHMITYKNSLYRI